MDDADLADYFGDREFIVKVKEVSVAPCQAGLLRSDLSFIDVGKQLISTWPR